MKKTDSVAVYIESPRSRFINLDSEALVSENWMALNKWGLFQLPHIDVYNEAVNPSSLDILSPKPKYL